MTGEAPIIGEQRHSRLRRPLANLALLAGSTVLVIALGEGLFRYRFGPSGYRPHPEVLRIQQYLVTQPGYGFSWQPNISANEEIVFNVADVAHEPLSTDANGFINHPEAIPLDSADIIGLGDSFVEHAAHEWFELFREAGYAYHNLAIHRTAPPQYARVYQKYGADRAPTWVLVGLFENDFAEAWDFDNWSKSGCDWFTYHSGTWCGPAANDSLAAKMRDAVAPGWTAALKNARSNLRGESMSVLGPNEFERALVFNSTIDIVETANERGARAIVVLIPSKPTATHEFTKEAHAFNEFSDRLQHHVKDVDLIDLRKTFKAHESPQSLYYEIDGHWNAAGMRLAGETILNHIRSTRKEARPERVHGQAQGG